MFIVKVTTKAGLKPVIRTLEAEVNVSLNKQRGKYLSLLWHLQPRTEKEKLWHETEVTFDANV